MNKLKSAFLYSSACILIVTAIAKLYTGTSSVKMLTAPDPLLHVNYRWLMLGAGVCELVVAAVLLLSRKDRLKYLSLFWLSLNFALYHIGYFLLGLPQKLCPCLGHLTDALHLKAEQVEPVLQGIVAYLLAGSLLGLLAHTFCPKTGSRNGATEAGTELQTI